LVTAIVSPRETLGEAADVVADEDVTLVHPSAIEALGDRAVLALGHLRGGPATLSDAELAQQATLQFTEQALDSNALVQALRQRPLRPAPEP
jgi:hypothetical protein